MTKNERQMGKEPPFLSRPSVIGPDVDRRDATDDGRLRVADRARLLRRGLRLEYATLSWNVVEIGFLVAAAIAARSVTLAGFAADSLIDIFASVIVIGQLKGDADEAGERRGLRRIGLAFGLLAVYVTAQAVVTVVSGVEPWS